MSTSAIIMMLVALIVIWGGFIVSVLRLQKEKGWSKRKGGRKVIFQTAFLLHSKGRKRGNHLGGRHVRDF